MVAGRSGSRSSVAAAGSGGWGFFGADAYYHARRIWYSVVNFPEFLHLDPYLNFPEGGRAIWSSEFDWLAALKLRRTVRRAPCPPGSQLTRPGFSPHPMFARAQLRTEADRDRPLLRCTRADADRRILHAANDASRLQLGSLGDPTRSNTRSANPLTHRIHW
jgi:hypothetical protein